MTEDVEWLFEKVAQLANRDHRYDDVFESLKMNQDAWERRAKALTLQYGSRSGTAVRELYENVLSGLHAQRTFHGYAGQMSEAAMSRFRGEYEDDVAAGRQRAAEGQRQYDEEQDRDYLRWKNQNAHLFAEKSLFEQEGEWNFLPLTEESGHVSGFKVLLNGRHVAMVIPIREDIVVLMVGTKGDVTASYKRGQHIDAKLVLDRFTEAQGALPGGT